MRLQYPFLKAPNDTPYSSKELFDILARETSGHYLLGNHNFWHGGIHFTDQVHEEFKNAPVRSIADGTVVAYRINKRYPMVYVDRPDKKICELYRYATSFCLIKHEYESTVDANPIRHTPVAPATPQGWVGKTIVFERSVTARNPTARTDQDASYRLKVEIPSGSKATVTAVDADGYVTATMSYFGENIVMSGSRGSRSGVTVSSLSNKKRPLVENVDPEELSIGEDVYFKAFDGNIMQDAGRGLFTEDIPAPTANAAATTTGNANSSNTLTFYSLYMHLLPFEAYEGKTFVKVSSSQFEACTEPKDGASFVVSPKPPVGTLYEVVGQKNDGGFAFLLGYRVDAQGNRASTIPVWFKEGVTNAAGVYQAHVAPHSIANIQTRKKEPLFWQDNATIEATVLEDSDAKQIFVHELDTSPSPVGLKYTVELKSGSIFTYNPQTDKKTESVTLTELTTGGVSKSVKTVTYMKCRLIQNLSASQIPQTFYLIWDEDTQKRLSLRVTPYEFETVVNCNIPIEAGETVGYLGAYETPVDRDGGIRSKHQLHFEIFSCEEPAQIKRFLDNAANIKTGRRYVKADQGTEIIFADNPPAADTVAAIPAANRLALPRLWVRPVTEMTMSKDDQDQVWLGSQEFNDTGRTGWIRENANGVQILTQHDLAKLGFTPVEEQNRQATGYDETGEVWAGSNEVSEFFNEIYNTIIEDEEITPQEITDALRNAEVADQVRKIIPYHPSEWKTNDTLLGILRRVAMDLEELEFNLLHAEIEKMEALAFWDDVNEINTKDRAHFFHPITFIQYLGPNVEKPIKIAIDAGHGGALLTSGKRTPALPKINTNTSWDFNDLGTVEVYEWDFNDAVVKAFMEEMQFYQNVEVKRLDDETGLKEDTGLTSRMNAARQWGAKFLLSCHHNAAGGAGWRDDTQRFPYACTLIHHTNANNTTNPTVSRRLSLDVSTRIANAMGNRDNGLYIIQAADLPNYGYVREWIGNNQTLLYVEGAFMNSKSDVQRLLDNNHKLNLEKLRAQGKAIAEGVAAEFGLIKL